MTVRSFVTALLEGAQQENDDAAYDTISVWRESLERENELVNKGRALIARHGRRAYGVVARSITLADKIARGEVEAMNGTYPGFPVLELELGKLRRDVWFIYLAAAATKSCLLLISEGTRRDEAKRRARIWIEKCPNRERHGDPVIIDLTGELLEAPPRNSNDNG